MGNRLALVGTVLYFMEWVVIPFAPALPTDRLGHDPATTAAAYADHPGTTALLAGWLSFVLLGRVGFCAGLRNAFRASPRALVLADWAFGAMVVSIVVEVLSYGLVATGGWLADAGSGTATIVAMDAAGTVNGLPLVGFWVWIIATSVFLFRHAPRGLAKEQAAG